MELCKESSYRKVICVTFKLRKPPEDRMWASAARVTEPGRVVFGNHKFLDKDTFCLKSTYGSTSVRVPEVLHI